jgi:hypothetical protein
MHKNTARAAAVGAAALLAAALTGGQASAEESRSGRITSVQQLQENILWAAAHELETAGGAELGTDPVGRAASLTRSC